MMNIPKILKTRRQELGISQATLAKYIGYKHGSSIHWLEVGRSEWKIKDVIKACELLELTLTIKRLSCII